MKKSKFLVATLIALFSGVCWVVKISDQTLLPDKSNPLILYSNQSRQNLQLVFAKAINETNERLYLQMYSLTDPYLLALLAKKSAEGVKTQFFVDSLATPSFPLPGATPISLRKGGLMHRKIFVSDKKMVFIGSANFTTTSLRMHDNLVVGLYSPELASFLTQEAPSPYLFSLGKIQAEAWLLPSKQALGRVDELIKCAKKEIHVALFTLTHPALTDSLIAAKRRGVDVRIAIDHYTAAGASAKMLKRLRLEGIPIQLSQGQQLFHHKWALIDRSTLIVGSTNWTEAAFTRNEECFLILHSLPRKEKKKIQKIWNIIELESINW